MKPLLVSSGEPAGIGPDLCLALAAHQLPVVIIGDPLVLKARAQELRQTVNITEYHSGNSINFKPGYLHVLPVTCPNPVITGQLNPVNASYVIELLTQASDLCDREEFSGLVTAPVHKANINAAGIYFTGHTEFLADYFKVQNVVMMLACPQMRVALVTTHLPLRDVPEVISSSLIIKVITQVHQSLINEFGIVNPIIKVAGLNPHAGEGGYLGREEIEIISPALAMLKKEGINVLGPLPADTMFIIDKSNYCDAYITMYHDQGLPILKYVGFNSAVNVTLGLPIIRTSVDHGTALDLAGKNVADSGSMFAAVNMAIDMASKRIK